MTEKHEIRPVFDGRYRHVIWDWNGTLLDDVVLCLDVLNSMLRARGMPEVDREQYRDTFHFPVREYYRSLGFDFLAEPFERLAYEYGNAYNSRVTECGLHADASGVLELVSDQGMEQYLLSAHEHRALLEALEIFGIRDRFHEVVGQSDNHASGKIAAGLALIERMRLDPKRTILIGDTLHDHEVASALGVDCLLVCNGHHSRRRLEAVHDRLLDSLALLRP
ncbi:MAG TPA: HAD family hydrolase [Woeseiaceae bacterium]|nr:HAD family hydrolase [Woeseiaceae bacterium]